MRSTRVLRTLFAMTLLRICPLLALLISSLLPGRSAVGAAEYPELVRQYRVTGVPKTVINNRVEILGTVPEESFVSQILEAIA